MKLRALRVQNVGPFGEEGCALEGLCDGLNVIRERNEAGKSTLFTALQMVLFEKHSSKKAAVQDFRHDRGVGAPHIELDVELDGRTYRIAKQYLSGAGAVVLDAASGERLYEKRDAENWIAQAMGGDRPGDGPSGLLWVRQGDPLLQPKPEGSAGDALFSLLEGEVDAVTGGKRAIRVLERAQARLAEIVTARKMSPTGRFKQALERCEALEAEIADHEAALRRSEADRERLVQVVEDIAAMTDEEDVQIKMELKEAQIALEAAKGAAQKIRELERELASFNDGLKPAEAILARFNEDRQQAATLKQSLDERRQKADGVRQTVADQENALAQSAARADAAKAARASAKAAYQEALRLEKAHQDARRRTVLQRDIDHARTLMASKGAAERAAAVALPAVSDLEDAARAVLELEAEARASLPRLTVTRSGGPVRINGDLVEQGSSAQLSGAASLVYQDLELKIDAPDAQGLEGRLAKAKLALEDLLESFGASSVAAARRRHQDREAAIDTAKRLAQELKAIAPDGVAALEAALGELPDTAEEAEPAGDLERLAADAETAEQAEARLRGDLEAARDVLAESRRTLAVHEETIKGKASQLEELEAALGDAAGRDSRQAELERAVETARRRRDEAQDRLDEAISAMPSLDGAEARVKRWETTQKNRSTDRLRLYEEQAALRARLDQAGQSGAAEKLAAAETELSRWRERIAVFEAERDALDLLVEELITARASRRNAFFAPVRREVDPLLSMVLGSSSLGYDDTLGPDQLERKGRAEKLSRLSGGTQEQIAVLTRLGFAKVMAAKGRHMPIVLDDALVYSDDDRIQKLFDAINFVAADVQIIAFSCRQKTFEALGGHTVHPTGFAG